MVSASTSGTMSLDGVPPVSIKQEQPDVSEVAVDPAVRDVSYCGIILLSRSFTKTSTFYILFSLQEEMELDMPSTERERRDEAWTRHAALEVLLPQQMKFLEKAREMTTGQFLYAAAQLCHMDTSLAESMWLDVFPRLWSILTDHQREVGLCVELTFVYQSHLFKLK